MKTLKVFYLVLALGIASIVIGEAVPAFQLSSTNDKLRWIQKEIYSDLPRKVDYAFIGSSHSWCAISARQIEAALPGKVVWNLGRNWVGRDLDAVIVRHLLSRHEVGHLIVEFDNPDMVGHHPYFQYFLSWEEMLDEWRYFMVDPGKIPFRYNLDPPATLSLFTTYVAQMAVRVPRGLMQETIVRMRALNPLAQRAAVDDDSTGGFLPRKREESKIAPELEKAEMPDWSAKSRAVFPEGSLSHLYTLRIIRLAGQPRAELSFLFVPVYRGLLPSAEKVRFYRRMGRVLLPDLSGIYEAGGWFDTGHLNTAGAKIYTAALIRLLQHGEAASLYYQRYRSGGDE